MFNLHPVFAHFPFVLLVVAVVAEFFHSNKAVSRWLVLAVCVTSPLTYLSGYIGLEFANIGFDVSKDAISLHQLYAKIYLITLIPTLLLYLLREESGNIMVINIGKFFLLVALAAASFASYLGGDLVFSHGAGVRAGISQDGEG